MLFRSQLLRVQILPGMPIYADITQLVEVIGSNPIQCQFESDYPYHQKEVTMKVVLEIRAAEGGEDSKLFVKDLSQAYIKMFERVG